MGKVLVIRGGAIGDFLLTLPAVKLLRDNLPDAWIEVLGYDAMVELARDAGIVHDGRSIEYAALARFFTPGAELDEGWVEYFASFDLIVSYLYDPDRFFLNNLLRCGVKEDNILQGVAKVVSDTEHAAIQLARAMESIALFLDRPAVDLDVWGENQRGESTCPGHATILLPSRDHGPVRLPEAPGDARNCADALAALVDRFADMERTDG